MAALNSSSSLSSSSLIQSLPIIRPSSFSSLNAVSSLSLNFHSNPSSFTFLSCSSTCFTHDTIKIKPKSLCRNVVVFALANLSDSQLIPCPSESDGISGVFPAASGVYAVFDKNTELQFIGISRNIASSVSNHLKSVPDLCSSVKVGVVEEPDRTALTQAWKSWMEEHIAATGKVPPGNESGNATWVRQPPKKKPDLKLTPGRHVQLTVPLEQLIDRLVKENKVVAFIKGSRSAPLCGFSQRVVGILESEGADYESVDVLDEEYNSGLRDTLKKYSNWPTFPQVFVNGELVGGCDILSSMHEKGELARLIK